jgi:hypothetical protein
MKCRACGNPDTEGLVRRGRWEPLCGRCIQWYWWACTYGQAVWPYERMFLL